MKITIKLFGPFRDHFSAEKINIDVDDDTDLDGLKKSILASYEKEDEESLRKLIEISAFADEKKILRGSDKISTSIALLPPVCGG